MLPTIDVNGDKFILHLPNSNRTLEVPANGNGVKYLKKIIAEAKRGFDEPPRGYVRSFPTQHVIEQWRKEDRLRKEEEAREAALREREALEARYGIEIDKLEIEL